MEKPSFYNIVDQFDVVLLDSFGVLRDGSGAYSHANDWLTLENVPITIFVLGISIGSFVTLMLFAFFAKLVAAKMQKLNRWMNEIIGVVLLLLGLYQLYRVIWVL